MQNKHSTLFHLIVHFSTFYYQCRLIIFSITLNFFTKHICYISFENLFLYCKKVQYENLLFFKIYNNTNDYKFLWFTDLVKIQFWSFDHYKLVLTCYMPLKYIFMQRNHDKEVFHKRERTDMLKNCRNESPSNM